MGISCCHIGVEVVKAELCRIFFSRLQLLLACLNTTVSSLWQSAPAMLGADFDDLHTGLHASTNFFE